MSFDRLFKCVQSEKEQPIKSRATLTDHLKDMQKDGLIERSIDDRTYHAIIQEDLICEELKRSLSLYELLAGIAGRRKFDAFLKDLAKDIIKYGEKEAFRKRLPEKQADVKEMLYAFSESKIKKLSGKYPDAMKELLKEAESDEN